MPSSRTIMMEPLTRAAKLERSEGGEFKVIWSTGAEVRRYDWMRDEMFIEELSMDPAHIRMDRFKSGFAPVLDSHGSFRGIHGDNKGQLGVIKSASVGSGVGSAEIMFSSRDSIKEIVQDVQSGIVGNYSVGYRIYRMEIQEERRDGMRVLRAVDWEPSELSTVAVPADHKCNTVRSFTSEQSEDYIRSIPEIDRERFYACEIEDRFGGESENTGKREGRNMPDKNDTAPKSPVESPPGGEGQAKRSEGSAAQPVDQAKVAEEATRAERARIQKIGKNVSIAGLPESFASALVERGVSVEDSAHEIFTEMERVGKQRSVDPTHAQHISAGASQDDKFFRAAETALHHRAHTTGMKLEPIEKGNDLRSMSISRLTEECFRRSGMIRQDQHLPDKDLWRMALMETHQYLTMRHSTSSFPKLLENIMNKNFEGGLELIDPGTYRKIARRRAAKDFRAMNSYWRGEAPNFDQIPEGGEYAFKTYGEAKAAYAVKKYGAGLAFTWEMFKNDDMDAFGDFPSLFLASMLQGENALAWSIITSNALAYDGIALFNSASHGNDEASAALTPTDGIEKMTISFNKNRFGINTGANGEVKRRIVVRPTYLAVPSELYMEALQAFAAIVPNQSNQANVFAGMFNRENIIQEPLLSDNAANKWYGFGSGTGLINFEYARLEGDGDTPEITQMVDFNTDGIRYKARTTFGIQYPTHQTAFRATTP